MSLQNIDLEDVVGLSHADLYGILADNVDDIIDEWVDEYPEAEAGDYDEKLPTQSLENENNPEAPNNWYPGNPTSMTNISFTGTPCLLLPHNMDGKNWIDFFFLFFNVHFCNLLVECANKCGNKLKTEANTSRDRFAKWKDLTIPELKVFIGIILFMRTVKQNGWLIIGQQIIWCDLAHLYLWQETDIT